MVKARDSAARIHRDPRNRSEADWLGTLEFLVARLAAATQAYLHIGAYWCCDEPGDTSASICARVRSHDPLPGIQSDYWEAAVCYAGSATRAYADVFAFPFYRGTPLVRTGPVAPDGEVDEFRWFQFSGDTFVDRGWGYPDGSGEWGWIKHPGDEYRQTVAVKTRGQVYAVGAPIIVSMSTMIDHARRRSTPRLSLLHVNRNRENTNLCPWNQRLPRENSPHAIPITEIRSCGSDLEVDLARFNIRGGWIPGKYHVALRVQNGQNPADWTYSSEISAPFKFTVRT